MWVYYFFGLCVIYFISALAQVLSIKTFLISGFIWYIMLLITSYLSTDRGKTVYVGPAFGGSSSLQKKKFWEL